jgi:HEAT repeat protein
LNDFVRIEITKTLGEMGPEAKPAVPALLTLLRDESRRVQKTAAESLKKIDAKAAAQAGVR